MTRGEDMAKRWRPWRFSLRFLLLMTLIVAAFCGGWAANDWNRKNASPLELFQMRHELIQSLDSLQRAQLSRQENQYLKDRE